MNLLGEILEKANLICSDRKQNSDHLGMRLEGLTAKGPKETFWVMAKFSILIVEVVTPVYTFVKSLELYTYISALYCM